MMHVFDPLTVNPTHGYVGGVPFGSSAPAESTPENATGPIGASGPAAKHGPIGATGKPGPADAGTKADAGKVPMHLISPEAIARTMQFAENECREGLADFGEEGVVTLGSVAAAFELLSHWFARKPADCRTGSEPLTLALIYIINWLGVAAVLQLGAKKYAPRNWEKGIAYTRIYDAAMRHLGAILDSGNINLRDEETGLPHVDHAGCCLMFLVTYEARGMVQWDDRP